MKKAFYKVIAQKFIEQLREGTAPFQKKWEPGELVAPYNPLSGTRYKGANFVNLMLQDLSDPRWMTYKQAKDNGLQVKRNEKGSKIIFAKFDTLFTEYNKAGRAIRDANGRIKKVRVALERPVIWMSTVFNATQVKGIEEIKNEPQVWNSHKVLDDLLENSKANIRYDQRSRAFYQPGDDSIHLPPRESFVSQESFYEVALHELAHWTGHPSRLDRGDTGSYGSDGYAREELRAEIASFMLSSKFRLGHTPKSHASYVETWVKILSDTPEEIMQASRDAQKIVTYILGFNLEKDREILKTSELKVEGIESRNDDQKERDDFSIDM